MPIGMPLNQIQKFQVKPIFGFSLKKKTIMEMFLVIVIAFMAQGLEAKVMDVRMQLTPEIIKFWNHGDDFGPLMTLSEMETFLEKSDPNALRCYKQELNFHKEFTNKYADEISELATEIQKRLAKQFETLGKRFHDYLKAMAKLMTMYPDRMLKFIENNQFEEAVDYLNDSWFKFEFTEGQLRGGLKGLKKEGTIAAVKGEKILSKYEKIRLEAYGKATELLKKFEDCIGTETNF